MSRLQENIQFKLCSCKTDGKLEKIFRQQKGNRDNSYGFIKGI